MVDTIVSTVGYDKLQHFVFYGLSSLFLGSFLFFIIEKDVRKTSLKLTWLTLVLIGTIEEYRQYTLPNRSLEFFDGIANVLGISCGLLIPFLLTQPQKPPRPLLKITTNIMILTIIIPLFYGLWVLNEEPIRFVFTKGG
ncbi:VanZ family protein [Bacillus timonensis]|nr:VanZ family protein [Bacillus timonensis]